MALLSGEYPDVIVALAARWCGLLGAVPMPDATGVVSWVSVLRVAWRESERGVAAMLVAGIDAEDARLAAVISEEGALLAS